MAVACLAHFWLVYCPTRRDAHAQVRMMDVHCEDCRGLSYDDEEGEDA